MEDYTLRTNLIEISQVLLEIKSNDAGEVIYILNVMKDMVLAKFDEEDVT